MEYQEFTGKTVDEAITEATIALETTSDNIEYEVVEEGNGGLLGLFSKEAVIKVRIILSLFLCVCDCSAWMLVKLSCK